jgi:hypothetical protein
MEQWLVFLPLQEIANNHILPIIILQYAFGQLVRFRVSVISLE